MENEELAPDPELKAGDLVTVLYKVLDLKGDIIDVHRIHGQLLSIDFSFANKYPYEVKFKFEGKDKVSVFSSSEIKFYDRLKEEPAGARNIVVTEQSAYIEWNDMGWVDDHQY